MSEPWFTDTGLWSGFSAVLFTPERARSAADLVDDSPLLAFPAGSRMLDQCCGPGFFAAPLARRGHQVTGVDLQDELLDRARTECPEASFIRADVRDYTAPGAFDVVVNMYTSFGYFDAHEDNMRVLTNAYESLAPGGTLLVDTMSKETYASWVGPPKVVDIPGGMVVMRDVILDDWSRYRTDWTMVRGGEASHASLTCWIYSAVELRAMFERAGFTGIEAYGGFDARPFDANATRLIMRGTRA